MCLRKALSAPGLWRTTRSYFERCVTDPRTKGSENKRDFSLVDCLMSASAMFSLKFPSLLQFDQHARAEGNIRHNLKALFGVERAPSDTQMREILDPVFPKEIRGLFKILFARLQRGKLLEEFVYLNDSYLVALDGTGCFSSQTISCKNCCEKQHKDGSKTYYHQLLSGVLVHPEKKGVIPFAPEPIIKADGLAKNDCERNAAERFLRDLRREHPHLKIIITEDGLSSNAPHIQTLRELHFNFILGCKPGDHKSLFEFVEGNEKVGEMKKLEIQEKKTTHCFSWINGVPLNDANSNCLVNFLSYKEKSQGKERYWSWVSDLELNESTVYRIMRAGRARWVIENETFNTLKNQGYSFEHNFGHGKNNLSVNLALLMMLSFFIDQVQQLSCKLFQLARQRAGTQKNLWSFMCIYFMEFKLKNWEEFLDCLAYGIKKGVSIFELESGLMSNLKFF